MANVEQQISDVSKEADCAGDEVGNGGSQVAGVNSYLAIVGNEVNSVSRQLASGRSEASFVRNKVGGVKQSAERQLDPPGRRIPCPANLFQRALVGNSRGYRAKKDLLPQRKISEIK